MRINIREGHQAGTALDSRKASRMVIFLIFLNPYLAGARKLVKKKIIPKNASVVGILTGNMLKDPDSIIAYHTGKLPVKSKIVGRFANRPVKVAADIEVIKKMLGDSFRNR